MPVQFEELFTATTFPGRTPELGHFKMVYGIIILLYIGFNRIWHFLYLRFDLDAVQNLWGGQASLCDNVLEVCELIGDQPREIVLKVMGSFGGGYGKGMRDKAYVGAYQYGHDC